MSLRCLIVASGASALIALSSTAQSAVISRFSGPSITGAMTRGDAAQIEREWAQERFERPLQLRIGADRGDGLEVAKLARWLQERRPVIKLGKDCIEACARDLLPAGRAWLADDGVLIAFSSLDAWPPLVKQAVDEGRLFLDDNGASQASRDRFMAKYQPFWEQAAQILSLREQSAGLPAPAQQFLDRLTRPTGVDSLTFSGSQLNFALKNSELGCIAWVPDVRGLKQLGIDLPSYQPPALAEAARRLKLPVERIYIGSIPDAPPEGPLCRAEAAAAP